MSVFVKFVIFGGSFLIGSVVLMDRLGRSPNAEAALLAWFALFAVGQFFVLRCPRCRRFVARGWATLRRRRFTKLFACRHCGKPY